jgi:hypothetical protein
MNRSDVGNIAKNVAICCVLKYQASIANAQTIAHTQILRETPGFLNYAFHFQYMNGCNHPRLSLQGTLLS